MLSAPEPSSSLPSASNVDSEHPSANQDHSEVKKKKKKRHRDESLGTSTDGVADPDKKKKKRKHRGESEDVQEVVETLVELERTETPDTVIGEPPRKRKKKKDKKKDKGKEVAAAPPEPPEEQEPQQQDSDADIDANAQASTAALLSAIVAAVSTTAPEAGHQPPYPPPPEMMPQQAFMGFPPPAFGFPPFPQGDHGTIPFLPNLPTNTFSELAYGSNDDVIRALQDLDMSKIASVLKTLGEAAAAANVPNTPAFPPAPTFVPQPLAPPTMPTPVGQVPVNSNAILGLPQSRNHAPTRPTRPVNVNPNAHRSSHHTSQDHAELLCTKWLNASKLAELVETEGLIYKKGKFSATEAQQLHSAIEKYRAEKELTQEQILELIFPKNEKNKDNQFWTDLTRAVPQRPIIAVYHHVRRSHHPMKQQGSWTVREDGLLKQAVADLGQQWEKISARVGRMSSDCRDRYRNHILNREIRVSGAWSKDEEDELTRIVTDMTIKQGRDIDNDVFWGRVSELMGGRRGRQQCRIKWTDSLSKLVKTEGHKPRWSQQDAFILVHKVDSLNVHDDTEIDWKTLPDSDWNLWSAHTLQRRWFTMKKSIKGYEEMSHQEIMDILRVKKAHVPNVPLVAAKKRKSRKISSAMMVNDENGANVPLESGSSTGPGTLAHADPVGVLHPGDDSDSTDSD